MYKKISNSLIILIIIFWLHINSNLFWFEWLNVIDNEDLIQSKDFNLWVPTYTLYYNNTDISGIDNLDYALSELSALNDILNSDNTEVKEYRLIWNALDNYSITSEIKDQKILWYTFSYFIRKYANNYAELLNNEPFNTVDSDIIISSIIKWIFHWFYDFSTNKSDLNLIINSLSWKLYLIKDANVEEIIITSDFLDNIYNVFSLEYSNNVNSQLQYYYRYKEELFWTKSDYLVLDYNNISSSYTWQVDLINSNYNLLINEINKQYSSVDINNVNNNIIWIDNQIDTKILEAKTYAQTDIPNIFVSTTKTILFTDLNLIRSEILVDLDAYKLYLINKRIVEESLTETGALIYSWWIYTQSWSINLEYSTLDDIYNSSLIWTWILDVNQSWSTDLLFNIDYYNIDESKTIISKLNDYTVVDWVKIDSREDYWLVLVNNIEKYSKLINFLSWSTTLSNDLFLNSVNFNILLKNNIKDEFININDNSTIRDIQIDNIDNTLISSNIWTQLLKYELQNFWKILMNNQNIDNNGILPSTSKVNNETMYKSYLQWNNWTYYNNYNKASYSEVLDRDDVEWFKWISFSYNPSPQQIKDSDWNQVWIKLWYKSNYYFDNSNSWYKIQLEDWYDYNIKLKSYNWTTPGLSLNLLDVNNIPTSIVLKWNTTSLSVWTINSKIVENKNEVNDVSSLFVNEILSK